MWFVIIVTEMQAFIMVASIILFTKPVILFSSQIQVYVNEDECLDKPGS